MIYSCPRHVNLVYICTIVLGNTTLFKLPSITSEDTERVILKTQKIVIRITVGSQQ